VLRNIELKDISGRAALLAIEFHEHAVPPWTRIAGARINAGRGRRSINNDFHNGFLIFAPIKKHCASVMQVFASAAGAPEIECWSAIK
jgi:hypothetical protein